MSIRPTLTRLPACVSPSLHVDCDGRTRFTTSLDKRLEMLKMLEMLYGKALMKTISVDDDVYEFLVRNTKVIGESASDILRRLLSIGSAPVAGGEGTRMAAHEFSDSTNDPRFLRCHAAVDKFLYFLALAYAQKRGEFEKVLAIQGRGRRYFAKSEKDIENSGQSTQPRNIPGSPFWVMTNSPTPQKRQMLRDALSLLGYSESAIRAAVNSID